MGWGEVEGVRSPTRRREGGCVARTGRVAKGGHTDVV